jgi:hypothetical protein
MHMLKEAPQWNQEARVARHKVSAFVLIIHDLTTLLSV